jgi:hypothetical protein
VHLDAGFGQLYFPHSQVQRGHTNSGNSHLNPVPKQRVCKLPITWSRCWSFKDTGGKAQGYCHSNTIEEGKEGYRQINQWNQINESAPRTSPTLTTPSSTWKTIPNH